MTEVRVGGRGVAQLENLGRVLKETGNRGLRKELLRGFRVVGKPLVAQVRSNARQTLPHSGGLAELVASSKIGTRTRLTGSQVGVRIEGNSPHDNKAMDAGRVRHPVWGGPGWAQQSVTPGWFTKPLESSAPVVRRTLQVVMSDVAAKIERSV